MKLYLISCEVIIKTQPEIVPGQFFIYENLEEDEYVPHPVKPPYYIVPVKSLEDAAPAHKGH